jgi:hypothetical protein
LPVQRALGREEAEFAANTSAQPACSRHRSQRQLSGAPIGCAAFFRYIQRKSIFEKEFWSANDCAPATHGSALTARRQRISTLAAVDSDA